MSLCACGRTEPHGHPRELSLLKSAAHTAADIHRMAAWKAGNAAGRRLLQAAFIKWRNRVAQAVIRGYSRGPLGPNVERTVENLTDWEKLQAEGIAIFQPTIARIADTALTDKPLKMVKAQRLPLIAPATIASHNWSAKHSAELVTEIMADTRLSINRLNRVAVLSGRSSQALARDIRPLIGLHSRQITALGNYRTKLEAAGMAPAKIDKLVAKKAQKALKYRSEMIARTETSFSRVEGLLIAHKKMGIPKLRWLADPECCAICLALSGKVYGIEQASGMIPKHPQCVLPGNLVMPGGKILAGFRARYDGPIIRIKTAGGAEITVTPHHNLMTPSGFRFASALHKGDDLIDCRSLERIISGHPDDDGQPTPIEQIFTAMVKPCGMTPMVMPISTEQFHGDAVFFNSDIDVKRTNCLLERGNKASLGQPPSKDPLHSGDPAFHGLLGLSDTTSMLLGLALAADGRMSGRQNFIPGQRIGDPLPHKEASLGISPTPNSSREEPVTDRGPADPERLREILFRFSRQVTTDKIIDIQHDFYQGHVYDLQTSTTLYTINGYLASNCECTWVAATQADLEPGIGEWPYVGEPPISAPRIPKIPSPAQAPAPPPAEPIPGPEPIPAPQGQPLGPDFPYESLTREEMVAINEWVGSHYSDIRGIYAGTTTKIPPDMMKWKNSIDAVFEKYGQTIAAHDKTLYRGISVSDDVLKELRMWKPGDLRLIDKAPQSWSIDGETALDFSRTGGKKQVVFELQKGRKSTFEIDLSTNRNKSEGEVIMRDKRFQVVKITEEQDTPTRKTLRIVLQEAMGKADRSEAEMATALAASEDWKMTRLRRKKKRLSKIAKRQMLRGRK